MDTRIARREIWNIARNYNDVKDLAHLLRPYFLKMPLAFVQLNPVFICRARPNWNGDVYHEVGELSYPPDPNKIGWQRANFPGQQVFYGAIFDNVEYAAHLETALEHVKDHKINNLYFTLSRWNVTKPLQVVILPFTEFELNQNSVLAEAREKYMQILDELPDTFSGKEKRNAHQNFQYLSGLFCRRTAKKTCYKITAAYFNFLLETSPQLGVQFDALIYPSANTIKFGTNIVIRKERIDDGTIEMDYVVMSKMIRDPRNPKHITFPLASSETWPDRNGHFHIEHIF